MKSLNKGILTVFLLIISIHARSQAMYIPDFDSNRVNSGIIDFYFTHELDSFLFEYYSILHENGRLNSQFIELDYTYTIPDTGQLQIGLLAYDNSSKIQDKSGQVINSLKYLIERSNRYLVVQNTFFIPIIYQNDMSYCKYGQKIVRSGTKFIPERSTSYDDGIFIICSKSTYGKIIHVEDAFGNKGTPQSLINHLKNIYKGK